MVIYYLYKFFLKKQQRNSCVYYSLYARTCASVIQISHSCFVLFLILDDIMIYLEDCSRTATKKIEEEMAKASWLLSEHLEIMPKDVKSTETVSVPAPVASSGQMTPCGGSNSQTPTPELTSGRGTMVGNSSSINGNTDNAHHAETQTSTNDFSRSDFVFLSKPLKYWSSTPFTQEYLNGYTIPIVRPTPGISKDTGIHLSELQSDDRRDPKLTYDLAPEKLKSTTDLPLHNPSTVFSSLTWKSINCDSRDGPIPEKLRPAPPPPPSSKTLTMQSASRFEENCSPVVNTTPVFDSDERKSRFIAFTNSLTSLKDEFWRDINSTKMKRPDSITHEKINS